MQALVRLTEELPVIGSSGNVGNDVRDLSTPCRTLARR